jgi:hypothetical protein
LGRAPFDYVDRPSGKSPGRTRPKGEEMSDRGDEATPPPKRPDRFSEQPIELPEPFKSLVLDAAKSYLVTERSPLATSGPLAKPDLTPR